MAFEPGLHLKTALQITKCRLTWAEGVGEKLSAGPSHLLYCLRTYQGKHSFGASVFLRVGNGREAKGLTLAHTVVTGLEMDMLVPFVLRNRLPKEATHS